MPEHLDLSPFGGDASKIVAGVLDSTLVRYAVQCDTLGEPGDLAPSLAESWEVAADGKSLTFHLGDAVSAWGNEITAEDVKWSVEREMANQPFIPTALGKIGRFDVENLVEVVDPKTVKFNLHESTAFDVMEFASILLMIRDSTESKRHATKDDPWAKDWMRTNTADFGPWTVDRFAPGAEVVFKPNPNYTGERGNVDSVTVRAVPESTTRMQLLQAGDVDWAGPLTFSELDQLKKVDGVVVEDCVSANRDELFLQHEHEIFDDVRVRQAVSMAIDREGIVDKVYRGFGDPAVHGVPQYYPFTPPAEKYELNLDRARALLAQAGYKDGFSFVALYSESRPGPHVNELAVQVQADLKKVGIDMQLRRVPGAAEFFELVHGGRYEAAFFSDSTYVAEASYGAAAFTLSTSAINSFNYASPEYDSTLLAAQTAQGKERDKLIGKLASIGVRDMPIVYIVDRGNEQVHRAGIEGYTNNPMGIVNPARLVVKP